MKIITISREYGAGGDPIARMVAKRLGVEIYDRDIYRETARLSGVDEALVLKAEEEITAYESFIRTITPTTYIDQKDALFNIHRAVLIKLAQNGPCVFLGRCADVILNEAGIETVNVFIHADELHRAGRVGELLKTTDASEIQKTMKKRDRARHNYYHFYTQKTWGDSRNYTMCLDSGELGYETCVELICAAVQGK